MKNLQLQQFQELYLNGAFSEVTVCIDYTSKKPNFNIAFVYRENGQHFKDVGFLISQKNMVRNLRTLDSCFSVLHFVDSFKVEDGLYFRARV
jgi:hypothetical protein